MQIRKIIIKSLVVIYYVFGFLLLWAIMSMLHGCISEAEYLFEEPFKEGTPIHRTGVCGDKYNDVTGIVVYVGDYAGVPGVDVIIRDTLTYKYYFFNTAKSGELCER